jgi:hypothetical protein
MGGIPRTETWLREPPDEVVDDLVCQAMLTPGDGKIKIRELVRLVVAELQGQIANREYNQNRRPRKTKGSR